MTEPTFWNGEPATTRRVTLAVARGPHERPWYADLIGQRVDAVEVHYDGSTFYLDDTKGVGWEKVTVFRGSPRRGHASLYPVPGSVQPR